MQANKIVSKDEWVAARKAYLATEKEFTRARDALSAQRRDLPWVRVDKDYVFEAVGGSESLERLPNVACGKLRLDRTLGPHDPPQRDALQQFHH